ncbi:LADA_0E13520g1_1 [Lachancea dasiensis]|uniref:LADA_0E13520g1_1 n=1 Tax=Lachancea dasiensis TaxID=1072105 RepID=A0A1G4JFL2_9SACH|nr:LADA_0E13520g1_1 [Lachancea dasiensis]
MLGKSSPLKKFSHHRGRSIEESRSSNGFHRTTPSSGSHNPPVTGHTRNASRTSNTSVSSNFLAEQYERDRRAILGSCFAHQSGTDPSQGPSKSYVTHIRIIEDAKFPSTRPPVNSPLTNKKKRVLIISSLRNGTGMQIHKARENSNGSFQIGRTWALKELTAVERDTEQLEGFFLTMGKRYYWETNSAKERTVFIKTLIKIFMEDSGGRVPRLLQWDLSLFYLDETSYHRALITSPHQANTRVSGISASKTPTEVHAESAPHYPPAPVKLPVLAPQPADSYAKPNLSAATGGQSFLKPTENSNKQDTMQGGVDKPAGQNSLVTTSAVRSGYNPSKDSDQSLVSAHQSVREHSPVRTMPLEKIPYQQFKLDVDNTSTRPSQMPLSTKSHTQRNIEKAQTPDSANFLSELNSVLTDQTEAPAVSLTQDPPIKELSLGSNDSTKEGYELSDRESDVANLYQSASSDEEEVFRYANEDTNELSFEKGDEVRHSQVLGHSQHYSDVQEVEEEVDNMNGDKVHDKEEINGHHDYHEVSTIREEPSSIPVDETKLEDTSGKQTAFTRVNNEALMDTLEGVNWSVNDGSADLLYKLKKKHSETEYVLNRELISLPKASDNVSSYQRRVMEQCEKLDPLLSFFAMELSTVARDIEYVENQSNGLQVESANKKMLWKQLSEVLGSVTVDETTLNGLLTLPLSERNLRQVEDLLSSLHTALTAIGSDAVDDGSNFGVLRALKERRLAYDRISALFLARLVEDIHKKFINLQNERVSEGHLGHVHERLLLFSSLVLFSKDISHKSYWEIIEHAVQETGVLLRKRLTPLLQDIKSQWQGGGGDLSASDFSGQNQTQQVAHLEASRLSKQFTPSKPKNSRQLGNVISFLQTLETLAMTCQNFLTAFFHIGDNASFHEFITSHPDPEMRISRLEIISPMDADREAANLKLHLMTRIFQSSYNNFLVEILNISKKQPSIIPILLLIAECGVDRFKSSDQEFLTSTYEKFYEKFTLEWEEYITDQSRAIERATLNIRSMSVSPYTTGLTSFVAHLEDEVFFVCDSLKMKSVNYPKSRKLLDHSYDRVGQSLLKLVTRSAKDPMTPEIMQSSTPDGKLESISLLINCNWLIEILPLFGSDMLFNDCLHRSKSLFNVEKEHYAESLLRSTMNHLHSFVEGACTLVEAAKTKKVNPSQWAVYSQQNLTKILDRYNAQEIRLAIDKLCGIVQSDFPYENENMINAVLFDKLWSCIQGQTVSLYLKLYTLIEKHYKGTTVKFTKNEIISAFNVHKIGP